MEISTSYDAGRLTVFLGGELDHHEARRAMLRIDELLDEYLPRECALNLSGLRFMDSSGIAVIIRVSRRMQILGGRALCAEEKVAHNIDGVVAMHPGVPVFNKRRIHFIRIGERAVTVPDDIGVAQVQV